jgi:hypothetical protein
MFLVLGACLILLCLIPVVLWSFGTIMEYKPLDQDDAL